jgi:hypothetical protein
LLVDRDSAPFLSVGPNSLILYVINKCLIAIGFSRAVRVGEKSGLAGAMRFRGGFLIVGLRTVGGPAEYVTSELGY